MATTATTNVFSPPADVQQKIDALLTDLMNLGSRNVAADSPAQPLQGKAGYSRVSIPGADKGIMLDAGVLAPIGAGPFPVVILPGPLADGGWMSYPGALINLALRGYIAVAYTERGLGSSNGKGDVAGPRDVADGKGVIDWVLQNYPQADPTRIGCMGTSYGAGMSLLIAAHDPRVTAVAALSAWSDLGGALLENGTPHVQAAGALANVFKGNLADDAKAILADFLEGKVTSAFHEFSRPRSPANYLRQLEQHRTAILLSTFWHETIFSVPDNIAFFNNLKNPKRLLAQVGDHSGDEIMGFAGLPSRATRTAYEWMDQFVKNRGQDAQVDPAVIAETMFVSVLNPATEATSWDALAQPAVKYFLTAPTSGRDGVLALAQGPGGAQEFTAGVDTAAKIAEKLIFTGLAERLGAPASYTTASISRENALVWSTTAFATAQKIVGTMALRLSVTPAAAKSLIVAHLFDLNPGTGVARIITSAPYTLGHAGAAQTIDVTLHPADYRVEAGHQLQLVIDSIDPLFFDSYNQRPSKVTISTANGASFLNLPIKPA
jgi:predicted acyl esterase